MRDTQLVAPCCHDTASAIAGIPDAADDWAYISSGTWSLVGTLLYEPINTIPAREENLTNFGGAGGRILFHKNVNGMWLLRGCLDVWRDDGTDWSFDELLPLAEAQPAPEHLLNVDDPDLLLPGDMPFRINRQLAERGLPALSTAAAGAPAMTALILHSLAARYAQVLTAIADHYRQEAAQTVYRRRRQPERVAEPADRGGHRAGSDSRRSGVVHAR